MKKYSLLLIMIFQLFVIAARAADILEQLNSLERTSAQETTKQSDKDLGLRRFVISFEQPADHFNPKSGTFKQKLVLFHRDFNEPMVLQTSGYSIYSERMSRLATTFNANQLQIEHRFFEASSPNPKDWTKLDIRQSAEDFHEIVTLFKKLYGSNWVGTGASKGGMTSIFHRRFYPHDLNGTVADVAPLSFSVEDQRYVTFVDSVGGDRYANCRAQLEGAQVAMLKKKQEMLGFFDGVFNQLGAKEVAFEHAVSEMPFIFWQYGNPETGAANCKNIPGAQASNLQLFQFLANANDPTQYADTTLDKFLPYYFQAAAELGAPALKRSHLIDLLNFPYSIDQYLPKDQKATYSDAAMQDIKSWVANNAEGLMFVYGEFDPWTAGAYQDFRNTDNHLFLVEGGNHGSNFSSLKGSEQERAMSVLNRWFNKKAVPAKFNLNQTFLEDVEFKMRRGLRN